MFQEMWTLAVASTPPPPPKLHKSFGLFEHVAEMTWFSFFSFSFWEVIYTFVCLCWKMKSLPNLNVRASRTVGLELFSLVWKRKKERKKKWVTCQCHISKYALLTIIKYLKPLSFRWLHTLDLTKGPKTGPWMLIWRWASWETAPWTLLHLVTYQCHK